MAAAGAIRVGGDLSIQRIVEQEEPLFDPLEFFPDLTREALEENRAWLEREAALAQTNPLPPQPPREPQQPAAF